MPLPAAPDTTERFILLGDVGAMVFTGWIIRHARRLGLRGAILRQDPARLDLVVTGPPDLLDALALACSLGPQEVWVDRIDRAPENLPRVNEFSSAAA